MLEISGLLIILLDFMLLGVWTSTGFKITIAPANVLLSFKFKENLRSPIETSLGIENPKIILSETFWILVIVNGLLR